MKALVEDGLVNMSGYRNSKIQRLYVISAVLLLVGLAGSVVVYIAAEQDPESSREYEADGGKLYSAMGERSKKYMHDVELYRGKAAVLADDINRCFCGMWQGTSLAYILAFLTVMVSGGMFLVDRYV